MAYDFPNSPVPGTPANGYVWDGEKWLLPVGGGGSYNGITGAVVAPAGDKRLFVSTTGADGNNGLSPESAKATIQAALTAASGGGTVEVGAGTFTLSVSLKMTPGVRLNLAPGTIITQANGANLAPLIDFTTNAANGAAIFGGTIDGNRANSTETSGTLVAIGSANDVRLERVSLVNTSGNALTITTGRRPNVWFCNFSNICTYAVLIQTSTNNYQTHGRFVGNNFGVPLGYHVFGVWNSNSNLIAQNKVDASSIGGTLSPLLVNSSGTNVTWVSGPNFANVTPGMFVVMNGGGEYFISAKASNTSLTVSPSPGTTSNVPAIIGTGDLFGIDSSSDNDICDNHLTGGATAGIIISNTSGGQDARRNKVHNNQLYFQGECALCVSRSTGSWEVGETSFMNNLVVDCALSGPVAGPSGAFAAGISVIGAAVRTTIVGNTVIDDQATKTAVYWLGLQSVGAGQCSVAGNHSVGPTHFSDILGGFLNATLTGWGSGATFSAAVSQGGSYYVKITAGSGPAVYPNITFNLAACGFNTIIMSKCIILSSGAINPTNELPGNTVGTQSMTFIGTPVAGERYNFFIVGT